MERFVSRIIFMVGAGCPDGTSGMRKGRAMPILIWIATIACMLEIATGYAPGQSRRELPARSKKDPGR
jgi:hypothetical protein